MHLEQLVTDYTPPSEATDIIKNAKIALLVGISGAGKDTIKNQLLVQPGFSGIISHTTRAPRENLGVLEQDGKEYHFISNDTAERMLQHGEFVEAKFVHGTIYGTSIAEVRRASEHAVALNDIDVQGVAEYKAVSNAVIAIFVLPPSYDVWIRRLKNRYENEAEFAAEWPKRRASAIAELTQALGVPYYHFVINDELERSVRVVSEIAVRPDVFRREDDEARLVARDILATIINGR